MVCRSDLMNKVVMNQVVSLLSYKWIALFGWNSGNACRLMLFIEQVIFTFKVVNVDQMQGGYKKRNIYFLF